MSMGRKNVTGKGIETDVIEHRREIGFSSETIRWTKRLSRRTERRQAKADLRKEV